jgi:hypothetical protein
LPTGLLKFSKSGVSGRLLHLSIHVELSIVMPEGGESERDVCTEMTGVGLDVAHQPDAGRCQHEGCSKAAKGSALKYCMAHGVASGRCAEQGCSRGAQGGRQHCARHLGASRSKRCQVRPKRQLP